MKNYSLTFSLITPLAAIVMATGCTTTKHTVSARIEGSGNDSITVVTAHIDTPDYGPEDVRQTVIPAKRGSFFLDMEITGLTYVRFDLFTDLPNGHTATDIELYLLPGEKARIRGRKTDGGTEYTVRGSALSKDLAEIKKHEAALISRVDEETKALMREYRHLTQEHEASPERDGRMEQIQNLIADKQAEASRFKTEYIAANPDSELSLMLLEMIPLDSIGKYYPLLSERVRSSNAGKMIKPLYDRYVLAEKFRLAGDYPLKPGMDAPDFTLRDEKGEEFTLSSFSGDEKYIILDFWTHTCGPCRSQMPAMKKYAKEFGDKIRFVNIISCCPSSIWKQLIGNLGMDWTQLSDTAEEAVVVKYNVRSFPTKIVIDPSHRIEKVFIGGGNDFFNYISELYGWLEY